jgi:hypothetical protein
MNRDQKMYLVLAKSRLGKDVQFLVARSLSHARKALPRYSESSGYMTLWRPRWATRDDVKEYPKEFKKANLSGYEFKKVEEL